MRDDEPGTWQRRHHTRRPIRRRRVRRLLIVLIRAVAAAAAVSLGVFLGSVLFIGLNCYSSGSTQAPSEDVRRGYAGVSNYARAEASTLLTLPEWYIVYNSEEYARFIGSNSPSRFPFIRSIRQYWRYYGAVCDATNNVYPFDGGVHLMLGVIGSSLSIEYAVKAAYENTLGSAAEWIAGRDTPEDAFARATALEYGRFMHTVPWYQFPFGVKLAELWSSTPLWGPHFVRKSERKLALTAEYGTKAVYGWLIGLGSQATYGEEELRIHAWIENAPDDVFADGVVRRIKELAPGSFIVTMPRYEDFTQRMLTLLRRDVRILDIAGNDEILLTAVVPLQWAFDTGGQSILSEVLVTDTTTRRIALKVPVRTLHTVVGRLKSAGATIEHLYDY